MRSLQQSARLKPDFPETQRNLASVLLELGRPEDAKPVLRNLLKRHPEDAEGRKLLERAEQAGGTAA